MASHSLLQAFKASKTAFGAWLTLPGTFHARTVAQASPLLSWIVVDCEHGLIPLVPGVAECTAAILGARPDGGPSTIVRIPATGVTASSSWQIKHALDGGAQGVLVPLVSTAAKAREVVSDCRFPPGGRRGFGSPFTHGTWGVSAAEYLKTANDNILVMVQIENKEAVENVQEIANVDGVDALFIGPYDLSISMGYPPPSPDPHPEMEQVMQKILNAAHAAGKKCAIFCTSGKQAAARAKQGFDMINVTSDTGAMSEAIASHINAASEQ
ncbi:Phosphoenolpyruvate/pyruvate domain-containing protein [Agrocybe pediades]|nr:Phosphoenolpyruvate/pyruvate domain-containing protein [Agrocybe pediades]